MSKLTNVSCEYTGGGIWIYSALFNNEVWIYGSLDDLSFDSYDIDPSVYEKEIGGSFDCPVEHLAIPSIPYPTFGEILESIRLNCSESAYVEAEESMRADGVGFSEPCNSMNDATLESVFIGKSGSRILLWRFGWNDYSASWGDEYSVRGTLQQVLEELKEEI